VIGNVRDSSCVCGSWSNLSLDQSIDQWGAVLFQHRMCWGGYIFQGNGPFASTILGWYSVGPYTMAPVSTCYQGCSFSLW